MVGNDIRDKKSYMKHSNIFILLSSSLIGLVTSASCDQLMNLGAAEAARFAITDRVWPSEVGEADVCLWADDKLAAVSITIDDNLAMDHEWWVEMGNVYDWKFTWFVVSGRVGDTGAGGSWADFQHLHTLGHDIQSHTATHFDEAAELVDVESDYRESQSAIDSHITGHSVSALAYPGGQNQKLNDPAIAAKYYSSARGVVGVVNPANQINYMLTNSVSGLINFNNPATPWNDINHLLVPGGAQPGNYRGWYCTHFHHVSPAARLKLRESFDFIKSHEDDFWVGSFSAVTNYGQERDTATLNMGQVTEASIRFTLTDLMDDALFHYPLTVKVRVPDDWASVCATQSEQVLAVSVVEYEGKQYAQVQAIPDRGEVVLQPENPDGGER